MEEGALITDCKAQYGGGGIRTHQGTFEMKGGKITNCTGAGVMADAGSTFIVSGDATITGNVKADGTTFNVNLEIGVPEELKYDIFDNVNKAESSPSTLVGKGVFISAIFPEIFV